MLAKEIQVSRPARATHPVTITLAGAAAVLAAVALAGCTKDNAAYCCTSAESCAAAGGGGALTPCTDPARPYCDDTGEYGPARTCIADPEATACSGPQECTSARPFCVDSVCVECEDGADCDAEAPVCGEATHLCEGCGDDGDCAGRAGTERCDTGSGACVACLDAADCDAAAPVCDEQDLTCRGCAVDEECASQVCNTESGACVAEADVIYLSPSGQGSGTCTAAAPCNTFALGLAQVGGARATIKAAPGTYSGPIDVDGLDVTILARGATSQPSGTGTVVTIRGGADATIDGLTVTGTLGTGTTVALSCNAATLRLRRATVVANNGGGGVLIDGCEFSLVNNVIAVNGSGNSLFGGLKITNIATPGLHELQFNTITDNAGLTNAITGVECASILTPLAFANNIVYANPVTGTGTQVGGDADCTWTYSDIGPQPVTGEGNVNEPPLFVDVATRDFHLQPTSPVRDLADEDATVTIDIDGDARPQGPRADMGADEIVD